MRTTLSLDDDVAALLEKERERTKQPLKQVVNAALRAGLQQMTVPAGPRIFRTTVFESGECLLPNLDCTAEVLEQIEGPWHK